VHDLRTRTAGPSAFIQVHIEMDGAMPLAEAHRVSDEVEAELLAAFPRAEVIIHQDPAGIIEPHRAFPAAAGRR
jgi:ferrous-iron efflux pump FieF